MHRGLSITLIVPCLNEEEGLRSVLESVPACVDEVLVVDGGSTDRTRDVAKNFPRTRVILEPKRGYGRALRRGFSETARDVLVTADGDGTYPCALIPSLVDELVNRSLDFLSACRFPLRDPQAMRPLNKTGNRLITCLSNRLFKTEMADVLSGMWVFRRTFLDAVRLESAGWNLSPEIKIAAATHPRLRFGEHPIPYAARRGDSKLKPWRAGLSNILFLIRTRFFASPHP